MYQGKTKLFTTTKNFLIHSRKIFDKFPHIMLVWEKIKLNEPGRQKVGSLEVQWKEVSQPGDNIGPWHSLLLFNGFTDTRHGGSGILVCYPDGKKTSRSLPAGKLSTNYRAETTALQEAARLISILEPQPSHVVFLTDCRSAIQSLQSPSEQTERETQHLLAVLSQKSKVAVQWIPAHCGLSTNEEAGQTCKGWQQTATTKSASLLQGSPDADQTKVQELQDDPTKPTI